MNFAELATVRTPIEGPSPIKDPPLKIQIEDPPKSKIAIIQDPLLYKTPYLKISTAPI